MNTLALQKIVTIIEAAQDGKELEWDNKGTIGWTPEDYTCICIYDLITNLDRIRIKPNQD